MDPYLLLAVAEGCGPGMVHQLLDPFARVESLLRSPPSLPPAVAARLSHPELEARARGWLEAARALGLEVLTPLGDLYPARLRHLPLRPLVLFARGNLELLNTAQPGITVVGSRTHTPYGAAATADFASSLARAGLAIWSGLAQGVDSIAHRQALEQQGPTVAVLAGGLDHIYPRAHLGLAEQIVATGGLLLSEAPPGLRAQRGHFPRRNRILAGCGRAVLVIEAGLCSGSLHTANFACEIGVPVFALPGPYTSPRSLGCHKLIADGAQIASSPEELIRALGVEMALKDSGRDERELEHSADEVAMLRILARGPRPSDLVMQEANLPRDRYLRARLSLIGKGSILSMAGDLLALALARSKLSSQSMKK